MPTSDNEPVQYIIVRCDLQMPPAKLAVQVAHAAESAATAQMLPTTFLLQQRMFSETLEDWLLGSRTKIVLQVKDRAELLKVVSKLQDAGWTDLRFTVSQLGYSMVLDECRTCLEPEQEDGRTLTCVGLSPILKEHVPKFIKRLRLYQ